MEIKNVRTIEVSIPAKNRKAPLVTYLIEVTTDAGVIGIGESRSQNIPHGILSSIVDRCLKPLVVGCNPFDVELLYDKMYKATQNIGQKGLLIIAISGVELALWDIMGKATKQPVYSLIGGCIHRDIEGYASVGGYPPAEAVKVAEHYKDLGFNAIKFHAKEVESSIATRKAMGDDFKIMLDVNGLWTPDMAIKKAMELADSKMTWLECPVYPQEDVAGTAKVTAAIGHRVPICAGENEYTIWGFKNFMEKKAVNIINHDTVKCGGLWQAKKIAAMAEVEQILCAPHSACGEVGLETALHLTTSTPNCGYAEIHAWQLNVMEGFVESILKKPLDLRKGMIQASDRPGFGFELDMKVVEKYTVK